MAKVWYSLRNGNIVKKARTWDPNLSKMFLDTLKGVPVPRGGMIADEDYNLPAQQKPFTLGATSNPLTWRVKCNKENFNWITTSASSPWKKLKPGTAAVKKDGITTGSYKDTEGGKERTYRVPIKQGNKTRDFFVTFRNSSKIEKSTAGTEEQEKGSAAIFHFAVRQNTKWQRWEDIVSSDVYDDLVKIFKGDVPESWLISYFAQQKVLLDEVEPPHMAEFDHSGPNSFMEFVSKLVIKKFNTMYSLGGKKDSWNPADIWIIKKADQPGIVSQLEAAAAGKAGTQTIHEFNDVLRNLYKTGKVMGISLKKTGRIAYYEKVNMQESALIPDTSNADFNFNVRMSDFTVNFDIDPSTDMFSQDVKIKVNTGSGKYFSFQIKANDSAARNGNNLKFEPTLSGATSARLGKAPVEIVTELLTGPGMRPNSGFTNRYQNYPGNLNAFEVKEDEWKKKIDHLLSHEGGISTGTANKTTEKALEAIKESYGKPMDRGTNVRAKLMGIDFFYEVSKLPSDKRNEFMTDMIYLSQKKAFKKKDYFGPFGKIF